MNSINNNEYLEFAKKIAFSAGMILEQHRHSFKILKEKDTLHLDIATTADLAAEKLYINAIKKQYPSHGIIAEESGVVLPDAEYVWIIDPLDGTKEYIRNVPYYYTLLALERNGKPVCAVGYQPAIKRIFYASLEGGAYVDDTRIFVSKESHLNKSFINIVIPNSKMPRTENDTYYKTVNDLTYKAYRLRNTQWDIEALFNVAMGVAEAFIMPSSVMYKGTKWWDIAPGIQLVEIAGGKITDFYGNPINFRDFSRGILVSNGFVHEELLKLLQNHYPRSLN